MSETYALGLKRKEKEPYCIPMPLQTIDELTKKYTKKELLQMMKKNDSVIEETDEKQITLFKKCQKKWKEANITYINASNKNILTFSITKMFEIEKETKVLHILYNHFFNYQLRSNTSDAMKKVINAMNQNASAFLNTLSFLNYEEIRLIRTYLAKNFEISNIFLEES